MALIFCLVTSFSVHESKQFEYEFCIVYSLIYVYTTLAIEFQLDF